MSRMKSVFALLTLAALAVPAVQAQKVQLMIAGSTALWQTAALGAYQRGKCLPGATAPCSHYTSTGNFNLTDTRPGSGNYVVDAAAIWIVWDSASTPNVWAFIKPDSVVGDRCYYAQPQCIVSVSTFPSPGNLITLPAPIWGSDSTPPTSIQNLFTGSGVSINAAASDIRPEDALFATCRANSQLGGGSDGLAGLGYGVNSSGACPTTFDNSHLVGSDVKSGYPGSSSGAHVVAFNISGKDPFTGTRIPSGIETVSVGGEAVVFIAERDHELSGAVNASDANLQNVFSGSNCNASEFGLSSNPIEAYLREPTSGTMNTTEASVFRYPFNIDNSGKSQETGVSGNSNNPLEAGCAGGGGSRFRAIGTGEAVKSVQNSFANNGHDGVAYAFFSYGNIASIASQTKYGYLTVNGVDPIFHVYGGGPKVDPGQPTTPGNLPGVTDLPTSCGGNFPCPESKIWGAKAPGKGLSLPNVRNGSYKAWNILRVISNGTALANARKLIENSQQFVVTAVPDYIPASKVTAGGHTDPGMLLLRSHYLQEGVKPINISAAGDKGGDMGGCILSSSGIETSSDTTVQLAQASPENHCLVIP